MELRVDPNITSADETATLRDVYDLHNAAPDPDATGAGTTVAVVDTGVDPTHPVFGDVSVEEHDFTGRGTGDEVGHGTAVAGLISQLAPDADVVSLRIFGDSGRTGMEPIADAYEWLVDHADEVDVANFSWGARSNVEAINVLHRQLLAAGVQDVVAAGNTGAEGGSPATARGAFSVGALTRDGAVTRFSSYNPSRDNPDVAAIGKNLKLARAAGTSMGRVIDEHWVKASGTSFSAPITAGLASRYLSVADGDVVTRFEASARNIPETPKTEKASSTWGVLSEAARASRRPTPGCGDCSVSTSWCSTRTGSTPVTTRRSGSTTGR
ncbi:S8 family serine peptidase [Halobacteriaceae archaeon GCM10025711]